MIAKFNNKDGSLTPYSMACGYVQRLEIKGVQLSIYVEHAHYHVKAFDFSTHTEIFWETYETMTPAKKSFYSKSKELFGLSTSKTIELSCKK